MPDDTPDIPRELVERARSGDDAALERLVGAAHPRVHRWALVHTGDPAEADDLTQDVLIRMIRSLDTFHGDARFDTWLYSVTRNAAMDRHRKAGRRARVARDPAACESLVPTGAADPAQGVERAELRRLLAAFFEGLPERQRIVFDLVELQGRTAADVAHLLGIEPASVRAHLFKARRSLRAAILERCPELAEGVR